MTAPSPVRLSTAVSCTCSWNSEFPPTFPISGSVQMTPRFPPAGPDGHGSPPSAALSGRYDFLPLIVLTSARPPAYRIQVSALPERCSHPGRVQNRVRMMEQDETVKGSSRLTHVLLQFPPLVRQSILLFAAAGVVRDGHLDETCGKSRLYVFLGQIRPILESQNLKDFHSCPLAVQ